MKIIKKLENQKGITLIALVLTIVILVILSVVTINLIFGTDNLYEKAKSTKQIQDIATAKEQLEILKIESLAENYDLKLDNYLEKLDEVQDSASITGIERIDQNTAEATIGDKYKFTIIDEGNGSIKIEYQGEQAELTLSEKSGIYTYPTSGTFTIKKNTKGSCGLQK